jgi:hypothetical protein
MKNSFNTHISMVAAAVATLLSSYDSQCQISITGGGLSYSQNFDTLTTNTTAQNWTDNTATIALDSPQVVGLPGWYIGTFATGAAATTNGNQVIRAGTGSLNTGSYYSFGSLGSSDRALGTLPSDGITSAGAGALRLGARFVNNTGQNIGGFTFSYDGEQWRNAGITNINNQFTVSYAVFAPGLATLANSTYTALAAANFNTIFDGTGTATGVALDGNLAANRIAGLGDTVTGLSVAPGDEIWIRWSDANSTSADISIGIDDFSITFEVPEPSSLALLALGVAAIVRRRRN